MFHILNSIYYLLSKTEGWYVRAKQWILYCIWMTRVAVTGEAVAMTTLFSKLISGAAEAHGDSSQQAGWGPVTPRAAGQ